MKISIIFFFLFITANVFGQTKQKPQIADTVKKYVIRLTETEYQALQQKLAEAAEFEALQQKDQTLKQFGEFLKANTEPIKKEDTKK